MSGHHQDAEGLVQTALEKAYVRWDRVQRSDDPDAYVWRIRINVHRDRSRLRRVREWLTAWVPERQTGDATEQAADRDVLLRALLRLPPAQRLAVVLRYLEDRSETRVTRLLGLRLGTVRSQTARGPRDLRPDGRRGRGLRQGGSRPFVTRPDLPPGRTRAVCPHGGDGAPARSTTETRPDPDQTRPDPTRPRRDTTQHDQAI